MSDEILREIHAIKDASGARFASVAALARELATQERKSAALGRTLIALPLRRSKIGQAQPPARVDRRELSV